VRILVQHVEVQPDVPHGLLHPVLALGLGDTGLEHARGALQEPADGEELVEGAERVLEDGLHLLPVLLELASKPSSEKLPEVESSRRRSRRAIVDFPLPLSPTIATMCRSGTENVAAFTAVTAPGPRPKTRVSLSTSSRVLG
jgi:hypothetical protein